MKKLYAYKNLRLTKSFRHLKISNINLITVKPSLDKAYKKIGNIQQFE